MKLAMAHRLLFQCINLIEEHSTIMEIKQIHILTSHHVMLCLVKIFARISTTHLMQVQEKILK